jgi:phosphate transport system permease protein
MSSQQISQPEMYGDDEQNIAVLKRMVRRLHISNNTAIALLSAVTGVVVLLFVVIIVYLLVQGLPYLFNSAFYSTDPDSEISILPQIFNTAYILIVSEIILVPLALAAAIYLIEYARQGLLVTIIHFASETLAGVPSLVLGLFGYLAFGSVLGFGYSRLTGILTLICLNLPLALRLFEDALTSVPRDQREAALALGSNKWYAIRTAVLPSALPGIVTAIILSAGKVLAESAVLIFTAGTSSPRHPFNLNPFIPGETLTVHIYQVQALNANGNTPDQITAIAGGTAALLIISLLVINILARVIGRFIQKRLTAA